MFNGFSDRTTDFLWGVRFNNERDWFMTHKQEYLETLQRPLNSLANDVFAELNEKYPGRNLIPHVSRIYRDARRLFGRGPYKDTLWFSIRKNSADWENHPVFWFEICPEGYAYGMGYWCAKASMMEVYRKSIDRDTEKFRKIAELVKNQDIFTLGGEEYKKPKGYPGGILDKWYNKKNIDFKYPGDNGVQNHDGYNKCVATDFDHYKPEFVHKLVDSYSLLMPLFDWLDDVGERMNIE